MAGRLRIVNDTGLGLKGAEKDRVQDIRLFEESGSIQLWFETKDTQMFQYLTAEEAMAFAVVLERLAIVVFKKNAESIT